MPKNKKSVIVLLGRSGSGKGTQAMLLREKFSNFYYISTGDLFRKLAKTGSEVSLIIDKILQQGGLPFDDLATTLWMHEVAFNVKDDRGIIFDGSPRRLQEAKNLDNFLGFMGRLSETKVFLIDVSEKEAFNRLMKRRICQKCSFLVPWIGDYKKWKICEKCGGELKTRHDDTVGSIRKRLNYFKKNVMPAVRYYKKKKRLIIINGEQSIEKVFADILKHLK